MYIKKKFEFSKHFDLTNVLTKIDLLLEFSIN